MKFIIALIVFGLCFSCEDPQPRVKIETKYQTPPGMECVEPGADSAVYLVKTVDGAAWTDTIALFYGTERDRDFCTVTAQALHEFSKHIKWPYADYTFTCVQANKRL